MLAQVASFVSTSAPSREQFAVISFSILKKLHHCCSRSEIIVYNALALHADPAGHCWPGRARLADITGLSERQVSRATAELARKGLLAKVGSPGGRVDYWLLPAPTSAPTPGTSKALPPDTAVTPPLTPLSPRTEQLTDQPTERASVPETAPLTPASPPVVPEPEPPPPPEPLPKPVKASLSQCEIQTRAPLPEGWTLPEAWAEEAREQRPDLADVLETVAANFADYHASKATRSSCW